MLKWQQSSKKKYQGMWYPKLKPNNFQLTFSSTITYQNSLQKVKFEKSLITKLNIIIWPYRTLHVRNIEQFSSFILKFAKCTKLVRSNCSKGIFMVNKDYVNIKSQFVLPHYETNHQHEDKFFKLLENIFLVLSNV